MTRATTPRRSRHAGPPAVQALPPTPSGSGQAGFSLVELLIAVMVLMVGVLAVARLVPTAIQSNTRNRYDSTALILAQRQLDLMVAQDLRAGFPVSQAVGGNHNYYFCVPPGDLNPTPQVANCPNGTPGPVFVYALGLSNVSAVNAATTVGGANLLGGELEIDWTQSFAAVPDGYKNRFTLSESGLVAGAATGLGGANYETRWNVLTIFGNFNGFVRPVAKRITISVRGGPEGTVRRPATLTTWVAWRDD